MPTAIHDQFKAMLVELAEAGMEVSREMMIGVRKATARDERIAYGQAHDRAARSVRLTISLYEKLERSEREAAQPAEPALETLERQVDPKLALRKAQVRAAVRRSIEQDYEGEDAQLLETALDIALAEQSMNRRFMEETATEAANRIRKTLNLSEIVRIWLPDPEIADDQPASAGRPGPS